MNENQQDLQADSKFHLGLLGLGIYSYQPFVGQQQYSQWFSEFPRARGGSYQTVRELFPFAIENKELQLLTEGDSLDSSR